MDAIPVFTYRHPVVIMYMLYSIRYVSLCPYEAGDDFLIDETIRINKYFV